jgi:hypothetical protein
MSNEHSRLTDLEVREDPNTPRSEVAGEMTISRWTANEHNRLTVLEVREDPNTPRAEVAGNGSTRNNNTSTIAAMMVVSTTCVLTPASAMTQIANVTAEVPNGQFTGPQAIPFQYWVKYS